MPGDSLRHVDAFIAPSEFTRQRHLAEFPDLPITRLPHFLGATNDVASENAPSKRPYFLFVGRLEKLKGLHTVVPLFRDDRGADLLIAGDGDEATELKRQAGDSPHVRFLGRLTPAQLRPLYTRAVAVVVPSIGFEVFPLVVLEAFAARTPVIARDLGPLPELVGETGGGLLFRDDASLLAAMERLRADASLRDKLGAAGYEAWRTVWSEEAHLNRYFALIEEIRARKQKAAA